LPFQSPSPAASLPPPGLPSTHHRLATNEALSCANPFALPPGLGPPVHLPPPATPYPPPAANAAPQAPHPKGGANLQQCLQAPQHALPADSRPRSLAPAFGARAGGLPPSSSLELPSLPEHRLPDLLPGPQLPLQINTPPPPSPLDGAATVPSFVNLVNHAPSLTVSHAPSLTASRPDGFAPGVAPSLYPGSSSSGLAGHALGGLLRGMAGAGMGAGVRGGLGKGMEGGMEEAMGRGGGTGFGAPPPGMAPEAGHFGATPLKSMCGYGCGGASLSARGGGGMGGGAPALAQWSRPPGGGGGYGGGGGGGGGRYSGHDGHGGGGEWGHDMGAAGTHTPPHLKQSIMEHATQDQVQTARRGVLHACIRWCDTAQR
jgi:hypothetical protein